MSESQLGIIVQARMGSTRLPGKVLMQVGNRPLLQHIIDRRNKLKHTNHFIVATSLAPQDDILQDFCSERNIDVFRGDESNVLDRYFLCAKKYGFQDIVRLTADNPYFDYVELDWLLDEYFHAKADYANNFEFLPIGLGVEAMSFSALKKSHEDGHQPHHLEHVNEYILENPQIFKSIKVKPQSADKIVPNLRLTIDTLDDLKRATAVFEMCGGEVTTEKIIQVMTAQGIKE